MKKLILILLSLGALFMLCSCMASQSDMQAINARLSNTEKQIQNINSQMGLTSNVVPGQADIWAQVQEMRQDLNLITGQLEDMNIQSANNTDIDKIREQLNTMEAAIRQMASQLAIDLPAMGITAKTTAEQRPTEPVKPASGGAVVQSQSGGNLANDLYNSGTKAFSDRRYTDAVKIFTDFVNTYPKHQLTSNAYFWQGESYYQLKNYSNAIVAYQQVIEKFPGSNKLQSSMFKQGVSMYYRGQKDAGKVRLNELVRKYPNSPEADRAKKFLKGNP